MNDDVLFSLLSSYTHLIPAGITTSLKQFARKIAEAYSIEDQRNAAVYAELANRTGTIWRAHSGAYRITLHTLEVVA